MTNTKGYVMDIDEIAFQYTNESIIVYFTNPIPPHTHTHTLHLI